MDFADNATENSNFLNATLQLLRYGDSSFCAVPGACKPWEYKILKANEIEVSRSKINKYFEDNN